jgi:hypothetical protein
MRQQFLIALAFSTLIAGFGAGLSAQTPIVPPVDEIEVIPPKVDSEHKPRPIIVTDPSTNTQTVEIPPTMIVHRYYYTGDRSFQGPFIPGGPSVIVAAHPKTGQQMSLEAQLLPGAPRVRYTRHAITYDYGTQSISVRFGAEPCIPPRIVTTQDSRAAIKRRNLSRHIHNSTSEWIHRTGIPHAVCHVDQGAKQGLFAVADRIHDVGEIATRPVVGLWESTPISGLLTPSPESAREINDRLQQSIPPGITAELEGTVQTLP